MLQPQNVKPAISQKPQISPKPRFADTIEMTLPADHSPQSTWPLKNRVISMENMKKSFNEPKPTQFHNNNNTAAIANTASTAPVKSTISYLEEVALEEKRLINALKNGDILNEEPPPTPLPAGIGVPIGKQQSQTQQQQIKENNGGEVATKWGVRNARRPEQQVPHPELTTTQRQHLRQTAANPVRPFLTRGSVAERVLIFERCPSDLLLDKRVRPPLTQVPKPQVSFDGYFSDNSYLAVYLKMFPI